MRPMLGQPLYGTAMPWRSAYLAHRIANLPDVQVVLKTKISSLLRASIITRMSFRDAVSTVMSMTACVLMHLILQAAVTPCAG